MFSIVEDETSATVTEPDHGFVSRKPNFDNDVGRENLICSNKMLFDLTE